MSKKIGRRFILPKAFRRAILAVTAVGLGVASPGSAQTFTQPTTGTAGNWSTGSLWSGGVAPTSGTTTILNFNGISTVGAGAYSFTNDIGAFTVNQLNFNNGSLANAMTIGGTTNTLTLAGATPSIAMNGPGSVTVNSAIVLNANATIGGTGLGTLTLSGIISGTGFGLTVNRPGTGITVLSGANTFDGGVILTNGSLQIGAAAALGTGTLTVNGGNLRFGAFTIANNITANTDLIVSGTSTPTLTGIISGSGGLRLQNTNTTAGLTLQGANTFTGAVTLSSFVPNMNTNVGPTLTLSGVNGSISSTQPITIGKGTLLQLTNATGADNSNRIPDSAPITVIGGRIGFTGIATSSETLGNINVIGGLGLQISPTGATSTLNFGALTRTDNAIIALSSQNFGTITSATTATIVKFASGVTALAAGSGTGLETGIVPFITASSITNPRNLATYDAANGLQVIPYTNATYFAQVSTSAQLLAAVNQNVTTSTTATTYDLGGANLTINSLANQASGSTFTNGTLTVFSGAITNFDPTTYGTGLTLAFGPRTGYLYGGWNQRVTGTATITGSAGLVVGGLGNGSTYTVTFENTTGNPFTGGLFVNGATTLGFNADNQLGAAGGNITLGGGELAYNALANLTISRPIKINEANGGFNFNVVSSLSAAGTATATTVLTVSSVISGNGALIKGGVGILNLTGANTYGGGTVIAGGTLQYTNDGNLGTAGTKITLNGGILQPLAAITTSRPIDVNAASGINTAVALNLSGTLQSVGQLYGSALPTLTKSGTGVLTLSGNTSGLTGTLAITAGGVTLSGATAAIPQVSTVTVAAGTSFVVDNTTHNPNRIGDTSAISLAGGFASYVGASAIVSGNSETLGILNSTAVGSVFSVTAGSASPTVLRFSAINASSSLTIRGDSLGGTTGNYTRILFDSFTTNQSVIPNVFFAGTAGPGTSTTAAGYDIIRGVIQFVPIPTTGTSINNFTPENVSLQAAYTTTGDTAAKTGVSIYSLVLDAGTTLTLNGGNAAGATNNNTPDGTLALAGGILTSQTSAKTIAVGTATAPIVSFGASTGIVTTTTDLTFNNGIALTGTGGLNKLASGVLTVNGAYNITGLSAVNAGTLVLSATSTIGAGVNIGSAGGILNVNTAAPAFTGISVSGGTTNLNTSSTITTFTASGGVANLNAAATITTYTSTGGTTNLVASSSIGSFSGATGGTLSIPSGQTLTVSGAAPGTFAGNVTGAGNISITGAGTLALDGNNAAFSGGITTATGSISTASTTGLGTGPISLTGGATRTITFNLPGSSTAAYSSNIDFATGTGNMDFTTANTGSEITLSGVLSGTATALRSNPGAGSNNVLRLTNSSNSFTGIVRVFEGFIAITSNGALGNAANVLDLNATAPGGLRIDASGVDINRSVTVTFSTNTINTNGFTASISGVVSGTSNIAVTGGGTLLLNGTNTMTGTTTVTGATLGGIGTHGGSAVTVASTGILRGGDASGTGTLTLGNGLTIAAGGAVSVKIGAGATLSNLIAITAGTTTINSGTLIRIDGTGAGLVAGTPYTYNIITGAGDQSALSIITQSQFFPIGFASSNFALTGDAGGNVILSFTPVPEPASMLLIGGAVVGLVGWRRRRNSKAAEAV